ARRLETRRKHGPCSTSGRRKWAVKGADSQPTLARGAQIERVLDYLAFVAGSQPLSVLLDEAPKKIAACVEADIASLYLLEGDGRSLVMRGNIGFPTRARGTVRLSVGEGITGMA